MIKKIAISLILFCSLFLVFNFTNGNILNLELTPTNDFFPILESVEINPISLATNNYFMIKIVLEEGTGVSSVSAVLKSPSQDNVINLVLIGREKNWASDFTISPDSEKGEWFVSEISLNSKDGRVKKYSKDEINKTFIFDEAGALIQERKEKCIESHGLWNWGTNSCQCLPNYELQDSGNCIYVAPCVFNYSPWSKCQPDGTQKRTVLSSSNCSDTDEPILTQPCNYSDDRLEKPCVFNYSPWSKCQPDGTQKRTVLSSSNCSDTDEPILTQPCDYIPPLDELFEKKVEELDTLQKIIDYLNNNFKFISSEKEDTYSPQEFFQKKEGGEQDFLAFISYVLEKHHFNYSDFFHEYKSGDQTKNKHLISVHNNILPKPQYIYFDNGKIGINEYDWTFEDICKKEEERLGTSVLRYSVSLFSLFIERIDDIGEPSSEDNEEEEQEECSFTYTEWSKCSRDGKRTRNVVSFSPDNCKGEEPKLMETCKYSAPVVPCMFTYTPWSSCQNGLQERKVISKIPANCSDGEPILTQNCENSESIDSQESLEEKQEQENSLPISEIISQNEKEEYQERKQLSQECLKSGISNEEECDIYTYQFKIVPECLSLGLKTQDQCRAYFLNHYRKPLKCNSLDSAGCIKLINNVILSTLGTTINEEEKRELDQVKGKKAEVNNIDGSIVIDVNLENEEKKEIKTSNFPLSVKLNENVPVKLISIKTNELQEGLSPVAISISSKGSDLPDDVLKRIGQDFDKEKLSGIDKAIVEGRTLEQPKFLPPLGESLVVEKVETIKEEEKELLVIQGKANPGEVVTLFIYSSMPIIVTVEADQDGNWIYSLDKSMVDGTHEVYAVLHNDEGKIIEASMPKTFFIAEAQAVSMEEMLSTRDISNIQNDSNNMRTLYLLGGISVIIILIALLLVVRGKTEES